jgi:DNA end-binding protein Ku
MARPIWSGAISFGLVNIPVRLFSATESHRVAFHELEQGSGARIHNKRVAGQGDREVPWKKIDKGFEIRKGQFVVLSDEELAAAAPQKTRSIDVEQFVSLDEIDPISWDRSYYLAPDGAPAAKAYALLRKAMEERQRVAIGRFVMRTKEYVACVRPYRDILALETMFFPDEVRDVKEIGAAPKASVVRSELQLAEHLIDTLTSPWDPAKYKDTYSERVMAIVRKKDKGQEIVAPEETAERPQIVDLMDALKRTLAGAAPGPRATAPTGRARGARGARSTRGRAEGTRATRSGTRKSARRARK